MGMGASPKGEVQELLVVLELAHSEGVMLVAGSRVVLGKSVAGEQA